MKFRSTQDWYSSLFFILRKIVLAVSLSLYLWCIVYLYRRSKVNHFLKKQ